jgi:hypothetical protein
MDMRNRSTRTLAFMSCGTGRKYVCGFCRLEERNCRDSIGGVGAAGVEHAKSIAMSRVQKESNWSISIIQVMSAISTVAFNILPIQSFAHSHLLKIDFPRIGNIPRRART